MGRGVNNPSTAIAVHEHARPIYVPVLKSSEKHLEFISDRALLVDALSLGKDYLEASGELPTRNNFQALYFNGYCEYEPSEIDRLFGDWEVFQADIQIEFEERTKRREAKKKEMLEIIELEQKVGNLHPLLFSEVIDSIDFEQWEIDDGKYIKSHWKRKVPLGIEVSVDEKIKRFVRFKIAEILTANLDSKNTLFEKKLSSDLTNRRTTIALGYNVNSGAVVSSFKSELIKSNALLDPDELDNMIEEAARDNDWLNFYDPSMRQRDLFKLKEAAETWGPYPVPERSYYNTKTARLLGRIAVENFLKNGKNRAQVMNVGNVLLNPDAELGEADRYKHKNWTKEDCLAYGRWLLAVVKFTDKEIELTMPIIDKAAKLGLGPASTHIKARFENSMFNFYRELGVGKRNPKGSFREMTKNEALDFIRKVANENGGKVSEAILRNYYRKAREQGISVPSPRILSSFCNDRIGELIEEAGFQVSIRSKSIEDILEAGANFYKANGRFPTTGEVTNSEAFPHWGTVMKRIGNIEVFHKRIKEHMAECAQSVDNQSLSY